MANTQFVVNALRFDAYKGFMFRLLINGNVVAGVSKVSPLIRKTDFVKHREGGDQSSSRLTPGISNFEPLTIERGVTHDKDFEEWAKLVWNLEGQTAMSLANFRKNLTLVLLNDQGSVAKAYNLYRCWVSEYQALGELDSNTASVVIEKITIQYEGFERDEDIVEPKEY
ncbi:phage tail protein [Hymenobacter volaticus]|uniref:Phage tail protein n=1 Tax=Hymenobacter volaticus TaxID=2932254 RepID=A0ABY4G224_9BACT|nr:phage tail protein [Hymenobacter volaticus]UOQ64826.1 phage tail protein [Hymenobacter volaticus]